MLSTECYKMLQFLLFLSFNVKETNAKGKLHYKDIDEWNEGVHFCPFFSRSYIKRCGLYHEVQMWAGLLNIILH